MVQSSPFFRCIMTRILNFESGRCPRFRAQKFIRSGSASILFFRFPMTRRLPVLQHPGSGLFENLKRAICLHFYLD